MFGVEPICRVLTGHGLKIATSTYSAAAGRLPSARALRDDAELRKEITRVHLDNYGVYGFRQSCFEMTWRYNDACYLIPTMSYQVREVSTSAEFRPH
ncbi:hypothetical protein HerbRD11066_17590 [Herbidospora sp. RD11066]